MAVHSTLPPSSAAAQHRLPTVSASQALLGLRSNGPRAISTGLAQLDAILSSGRASLSPGRTNGLERGTVSHIWGPPGSGKTTLALQVTSNALQLGSHVVWIDAQSPLLDSRLQSIISASADSAEQVKEHKHNFHRYKTPSLAHLLSIILHPPATFPPTRTSLLVIDGLHALVDTAYPRTGNISKNDNAKWAAARRYSVLGSLAAALKKLATLHDLAVIVTTACVSRARHDSAVGLGAILMPSISGMEWDGAVANQIVLFRDFGETDERSLRFAAVQRLQSRTLAEEGGVGPVCAFAIDENGLVDLTPDGKPERPPPSSLPAPVSSPVHIQRKRKAIEIADSEDEDGASEYGWMDEDELAAEGLVDEEEPATGPETAIPEPEDGHPGL